MSGRIIRHPVIALGLMFSLLAVAPVYAGSSEPIGAASVTDFVVFWAPARLLLANKNPFSPIEVVNLQKQVGLAENQPLLMWNPPWTLSFILPFGVLEFSTGHFTWLLTHLLFILVSARKLWAIYVRSAEDSYMPWIITFTLVPTSLVLIIGQITPLILLGIVGFIYFERKNQLFLAGASTALLAVKPHLIYLFWIGLALWMIRQIRWQVAFGALVAVSFVAAIPALIDPAIYSEFIEMYRNPGRTTPFELPAPSLGSLLKLYMPYGTLPLQFLPPVLATLWFLWHWSRYKDCWDWAEQMPLLLLVSLTMSAYAWTYDHVIVLPAVIQAFAIVRNKTQLWYKNPFVLLYCGINLAYIISKLLITTDIYYFWLAPAFLLTYVGIGAGRKNLATR
jgi:glycosyl transferase family 87